MMAEWSYPNGGGLNFQEKEAWEKAVEMLSELNGTLSMIFKDDGLTRKFEIIYIPLPTKEES